MKKQKREIWHLDKMEVETEGWLFRDRKSPVLLVIDLFSHRQTQGSKD